MRQNLTTTLLALSEEHRRTNQPIRDPLVDIVLDLGLQAINMHNAGLAREVTQEADMLFIEAARELRRQARP